MTLARRSRLAAAVALVLAMALASPPAAASADDERVAFASRALSFGDAEAFDRGLAILVARGKPDAAAAMILAMRTRAARRGALSTALAQITGHEASSWFDWMLWQETHPEIVPHESFTALKQEFLARVDPGFLAFLGSPWAERARMQIRLEEITWGGVAALTGIPSLDSPPMVAADAADYLNDDDLVFGVAIDGDARAYPLRIMGWHEMMNDVVGGVPVALAYCTLCGSGILYETRVEGREAPFVFGSSGLLYRSNKLMFDWATKSLWNQFSGEPVVGPLAASDIRLATRPVAVTTWAKWRTRHPATRVLAIETGHRRDYGAGVVYRDYFASPELMFPAAPRTDAGLAPKDYVFGIRGVGASKAWPVAAFAGGAAINDEVGGRAVVLVGDAATRTVRAYDRGEATFAWAGAPDALDGPGGRWRVTEHALVAPDGARLARVPGRLSYWFAWDGYYGIDSALYRPPATAR